MENKHTHTQTNKTTSEPAFWDTKCLWWAAHSAFTEHKDLGRSKILFYFIFGLWYPRGYLLGITGKNRKWVSEWVAIFFFWGLVIPRGYLLGITRKNRKWVSSQIFLGGLWYPEDICWVSREKTESGCFEKINRNVSKNGLYYNFFREMAQPFTKGKK